MTLIENYGIVNHEELLQLENKVFKEIDCIEEEYDKSFQAVDINLKKLSDASKDLYGYINIHEQGLLDLRYRLVCLEDQHKIFLENIVQEEEETVEEKDDLDNLRFFKTFFYSYVTISSAIIIYLAFKK